MKRYYQFVSFCFVLSCLIISCNDEDKEIASPALEGLTKLNEGYALGTAVKLEIWGTKNYFVGYNPIVVVLFDSLHPNEQITDAHIYFEPLMTMGIGEMSMQHACPVENPEEEAIDGVFPGTVIFTMPTSVDGIWKLGLSVHNHLNGNEGENEFDITVDNPETAVLKVFTTQSADRTRLILSLVEPIKPKVGINNIEFTLQRKVSMMEFPADDSYTLEISPEMPSMGHGSPNNVNPISIGNGHYVGQVNFTMTGLWNVIVTVKKEGEVVANSFFEISF